MKAAATYEEIEEAILHLPLPQRSRLAAVLIESLDDDGTGVSPEWREEIERRARDIDSGASRTITGEAVWNRVNERFGTAL